MTSGLRSAEAEEKSLDETLAEREQESEDAGKYATYDFFGPAFEVEKNDAQGQQELTHGFTIRAN